MDRAPWDAPARLMRGAWWAKGYSGEQEIVLDGTLREIAIFLWDSDEELERFAIIWKDHPVRVAELLDRAVRERVVA